MLRQLVTLCRGSVAVMDGCFGLVVVLWSLCLVRDCRLVPPSRRSVASSLTLWVDCYESVTSKD